MELGVAREPAPILRQEGDDAGIVDLRGLSLGSVAESVEVNEPASPLDLTTSQTATQIDANAFVLSMANIAPTGEEFPAVEVKLKPV